MMRDIDKGLPRMTVDEILICFVTAGRAGSRIYLYWSRQLLLRQAITLSVCIAALNKMAFDGMMGLSAAPHMRISPILAAVMLTPVCAANDTAARVRLRRCAPATMMPRPLITVYVAICRETIQPMISSVVSLADINSRASLRRNKDAALHAAIDADLSHQLGILSGKKY